MIYLLLFFGQGLFYLLATLNIRAVSKGRIGWTLTTDFTMCVTTFLVIQRVATAGHTLELLAYAAGGTLGSLCAMLVSRQWK